jgi:hypothetical protein
MGRPALEYRMKLDEITFVGPPIDDGQLLDKLPANLAGLLQQVNGFIQLHGGFHVRGACREPLWHSLRNAWVGSDAFHHLYPAVGPEDIPFAEDCMGDQFLLRDGRVLQLAAETGDLRALELGMAEFFTSVQNDPVGFLSLNPLVRFQQDGGALEPGQLLSAAPPFCFEQPAEGVNLRAVPADERRRFLAELAAQLRDVQDGDYVEIKIVD